MNELNAGYAADGYARVKGISAMMTTYGVGELSAINAMAGAFAEYAPIVHIVGAPSTAAQKSRAILHHTLGTGDFNIFEEMHKKITCAMAILDVPENASSMIDNTIRQCLIQRRPVYISLPTDMVKRMISAVPLQTPLDLQVRVNAQQQQKLVVDEILQLLTTATSPVLLVDGCALRHKLLDKVDSLVRKSSLPTFVSPMGKSTVDETLENFHGLYAGPQSIPAWCRGQVEQSDLVIHVGAMLCDINTAGFQHNIPQASSIELHSNAVRVKDSEYTGVHMAGILEELTERLNEAIFVKDLAKHERETHIDAPPVTDISCQIVTHEWLWPQVSSFLRENDILVTETGTSNMGMWGTSFPQGVTALNQMLWSSIGWSLGAAQGACLAARDSEGGPPRRTVLFIGDGSFQLGCQEISTLVRQRLNPIIFIICNNGFTIERFVHGMEAKYNDIQEWNHCNLPFDFGATEDTCSTYKVHTRQDWHDLVGERRFMESSKLRIVELHMPWDDAPVSLKELAASAAARNAKA